MFANVPAVLSFDESLYDLGEIKVVGSDKSQSFDDQKKVPVRENNYLDFDRHVSDDKITFIEEALTDKDSYALNLSTDDPFVSCFDIAYGSRNSSRIYLKDNFESWKSDKFNVELQGYRTKTDGWRQNDARSELDIDLKIDVKVDPVSEFHGKLGIMNKRVLMNGPESNVTRDSRYDDRKISGNFGFTREYNKSSDFLFDLKWLDYDRDVKITDHSIFSRQENRAVEFKSQYNLMLSGKNLFSIGYDYFNDNLDRTEIFSSVSPTQNIDYSYSLHNFFVQRDIDISNSAQLILRGDYDIHSEDEEFFSPLARIQYRNYEKTEIAFEGGKAFNRKTFEHILFERDFVSPLINEDYTASDMSFVSFSARHVFDNNLSGGFKLTSSNIKNYSYYEDDAAGIERYHLRYAPGDVDSLKLDLNAKYLFSQKFTGEMKYFYENTELPAGTQAPYVPKDRMELNLYYNSLKGCKIKLTEEYQGSRYADAANKKSIDSYLLLHAKLTLDYHENIEPYLSITNLFDKDHEDRFGYSGKPRTIMGGINVKF
jgi:outer membrane receptor for ferrienterochelin and colicin